MSLLNDCGCKEPGFCNRFKTEMSPHLHKLCQTKPAYRRIFAEKMKHGTCKHFDTYTNENKVYKQCCGKRDIKVKIFNCAIHGKCTLVGNLEGCQGCHSCDDFQCMECDFTNGDTCPQCGTKLENYNPLIPITRECYTEIPQMLYHNDGTPAHLQNKFQERRYGSACFYIGGGPSLLQQDLKLLKHRLVTTFAVNNVGAKLVKPDLWACGDEPKAFHNSIWQDPTIMKFVPFSKGTKRFYFKEGKKLIDSVYIAREAPNTYQFNLNGQFNHNSYLTEPSVSWGCDRGVKDSIGIASGRSVMFIAMKIMYYLGFSRVYLLGCDFNMQHDPKGDGKGLTYAFSQYKHAGGCKTNNNCYEIMNKRFMALRPIFEQNNFQVYNCTPNSNLDAFDYMDYEEAIEKERLTDINPSQMYI